MAKLTDEKPFDIADVPITPPVKCPVCRRVCRYLYRKVRYGDVVGCEQCICKEEARTD